MARRLMSTSSITFKRNSGVGYYNTSGEWVEGATTDVPTVGNIQPYRAGTSQMTLPEGLKAEDALIYYTETPINTVSQFTKTLADQVDIDSRTYIAHNSENWARYGLRCDHYKVLLVREDQNTNGGL